MSPETRCGTADMSYPRFAASPQHVVKIILVDVPRTTDIFKVEIPMAPHNVARRTPQTAVAPAEIVRWFLRAQT